MDVPKGSLGGAGGVFRGQIGEWLGGFCCNVGQSSAVEAELWEALHGLDIAWRQGFRRVHMEIDSELVVRWLRTGDAPRLSLTNLIARCKQLLSGQWEIRVSHVYREANKVADLLAAEAL